MPSYKWRPLGAFKSQQVLDGYVTVGKAAEMLGTNRQRVIQMIHEGKLQVVALGDAVESTRPFFMIDIDEVNKFRDNRPLDEKKRGPSKGQGGRPKKDKTSS